jgi:ribosomal protein L7/L12
MNRHAQCLSIVSQAALDWKEMVVEIAKTNPTAVIRAYQNMSSNWQREARILWIEEGNKVAAIKHCRAETGMGLKQAKEAVEALA